MPSATKTGSPKSSLSARIVAALRAGKSAGMAELIEQAEAGILAAESRNREATERALDPLLLDGEVDEARQASADATYERDRLVNAVKRLADTASP